MGGGEGLEVGQGGAPDRSASSVLNAATRAETPRGLEAGLGVEAVA